MKTKFTSNVAWLKPFLIGLESLAPIHKLYSVKGYKVKKGLNELSVASTIKHSSKKYTINIKTQGLVNKGKSYKDETIENLLIAFAHEIAHLVDFEHTQNHL